MNLWEAKEGEEYIIKEIVTDDEELNAFVRMHCPKEYELAQKMKDYIKSVIDCEMTEDETVYMALQLKYTAQPK